MSLRPLELEVSNREDLIGKRDLARLDLMELHIMGIQFKLRELRFSFDGIKTRSADSYLAFQPDNARELTIGMLEDAIMRLGPLTQTSYCAAR